ncbi:Methionine--tRNA ligase [Orchesella cincta]|uniref:Methionine--tRNA ligase n=1 Tax=Orchesella cincta TaxID=48709 RepID=A0A1D2MR61_ORCCI|nr:Methionine--tRNA ligase [Orchesella cincta]
MFKFIVFVSVLAAILDVGSPIPPHHFRSARQQIQKYRILPKNADVLSYMPSVHVATFKVGNGPMNLQQALGFDIPFDVIEKLESRVESIGRNSGGRGRSQWG